MCIYFPIHAFSFQPRPPNYSSFQLETQLFTRIFARGECAPSRGLPGSRGTDPEEERPKNEPSALQNLTLPIFPKEVGGKEMAPQRPYDAPALRIIFTYLVLIPYTNVSSAFRLLLVMLPQRSAQLSSPLSLISTLEKPKGSLSLSSTSSLKANPFFFSEQLGK